MNISDKNRIPASFIFHHQEEEKRRLLRAWKTSSIGPYICLPGRKRGEHLSSLRLTERSNMLCRNASSDRYTVNRIGRESEPVVLPLSFTQL
jgi:hypothetical protein